MLKSVFEMIGPVMVGPSSSHTAGMARIGAESCRYLPAGAEKIRITFSRKMKKTFRGHRSDCAVIGGALGLSADSAELKDAYRLAEEKGIETYVGFFEEGEVPENTARVTFVYADGSERSLTAQSVGGGSIRILQLDGADTRLQPFSEYGETVEGAQRITEIKSLLTDPRSFAEIAREYEGRRSGRPTEEIDGRMRQMLAVMKESVQAGLAGNSLLYGLTSGEDGRKLLDYGGGLCGVQDRAAAYAIAVLEQNASMGRLVAAPTGGSAGIIPGVLLAAAEEKQIPEDRLTDALFTAALFGIVLEERGVSFSGSVGGCQGEIGVSAALASAAEASLFTENKKTVANAFALTLKNMLGLVCDPVAGPIEVPCIKRNAMGVAAAMMMCDLALAGAESYIPADEVMDALKDAEERLPAELKCACIGGLACTETARRLRKELEERGGV